MRLLFLILIGFFLSAVLSAAWAALSLEGPTPDVVALVAIYLGMSGRARLFPSVGAAVVLGYMVDLLAGSPKGLLSFVAGVLCLTGYVIQRRLFVRGRVFLIVFSAGTGLLAGVLALVVRSGLGKQAAFAGGSSMLLWSAALTGLLGPLVFRLCRRAEGRRPTSLSSRLGQGTLR